MKKWFFFNLVSSNSDYSIKKMLAYMFSLVVIYLVIFTDKSYYELLFFIGGLLGVRAYEKTKGVSGSLMSRKPETIEKPEDKKEIL